MKREVIKSLVSVFLVLLVTMGLLPGEIIPGTYSNSATGFDLPPSL